MKVTLAQQGGQAAAIHLRRPPIAVDTATLKPDEAAELARLVAEAKAAPAGIASGRARDEMTYAITVEDNGGSVVLSQSDTTMSEAFAKLLAWLQRRR